MLRVVQSRSAAGLKDYFTGGLAAGDFTLEEGLSPSWWSGRGSELLGLKGEVRREDFAALADNVHPRTGEQLSVRMKANRRVAYDFNLHVPKSDSVLALVMGDERLIDAFCKSSRFVMRAIEPYVGTRVRINGKNEDRVTGNLVIANFLHLTTRPVDGIPDPHIHIHAVVFNATHDSVEDRWKAVQLGGVIQQAPFFQALFLSDLAKRVTALGYEVSTQGAAWDIVGVSPDILKRYSRRSQVINERILRDGIDDPKAKATYGTKTRESKAKTATREEVKRDWRDRLTDEEFQDLKTLRLRPVTPVEPSIIDEAVRLAVLLTFERSAVVQETALLSNVLKASPGHLTVEQIRSRYEALKVIVRDENGKRSVTTRDVLKSEKALVDAVTASMGTRAPLLPSKVREIPGLSDSEARAARRILETQDLVTIVRTFGVGHQGEFLKTMKRLVDHFTSHRLIPLGATAASVVGEIREARLKGATVAEFLKSERLHDPVRKAVLWVSDAHRLPVSQLLGLIEFATSNSCRIVLSGDRLSRGAVFGGNVLDILERHAGLQAVEIRASRAQRGDAARVVDDLLHGRVTEAQSHLQRTGHFKSVEPEVLGYQAGRALAELLTRRAKGQVIAPTRELVEAATDACRASLKGKGRIRGERSVPRLISKHLSSIDKTRYSSYKPGMVVRFVQNSGRFKSGQDWTITGVNALGYVEMRRGMKLGILPKNRPNRFDVYSKEDIKIGVGDRVRITKTVRTRAVIDIPLGIVLPKHAKPHRILRAGAVHRVTDFTATGHLVLDNGMILKKGNPFEHAYAQTPGAAITQGIDHVVVAVPKNDEAFLTAEQLAHAASAGRRSVTVVTDRQTLEGLRTQGPPRPTSMDVQPEIPSMTLFERTREMGERLSKTAFGVTAPHKEYERAMEM